MARIRSVKELVKSVRDLSARHRARHRPTGFGFAVADSVAYLDAGVWDGLVAGASVFLSRAYLAALEESGIDGLSSRCAIVFRGRTPVAAVAVQLVELAAANLAERDPALQGLSAEKDPVKRALLRAASRVRRGALEKVRARVLVCGNLFSWGAHGVAFAPGEDAAALWPAVAEAIYRIRRADKLSGETDLVLVKDLRLGDGPALALRTFSYRALETDPDMVLAIQPSWRDFEDYLGSLAAKYRKTALRIAADCEAAGVRIGPLEDMERHGDRIHALYLAVHQEARVRLGALPAKFLPVLARALGPNFRCLAAWRGADLVGFVTVVKDGETAVGYYIGFDRTFNGEAPVYFRLLQAVVAEAIAMGCRRLSLGRTALEPKARLGAKPEPLCVWVRHRVPALNLVVRSLLGAVSHDEAPERNPFK